MTIEKVVESILDSIIDPQSGCTAKQLKLKAHIESTTQELKLHLLAGFPISELERQYKPLLLQALGQQFPQLNIELQLEQFIRAHKTQMPGKGLRGIKNTIAIASGKGGVGKSTVTVNLAAALAKLGARVGILDADIYGPSIPLMLGPVNEVQVQENQYLPVSAHGLQAMSIGYLTHSDSALIWRGPMLAKSLIQMLDVTLWDELDYLFIDLPPGTGDIQLTLVQKIPLTGAIVVTTPQTVATLDAQKALNMFEKTNIEVLGIVENMATHICSNCGHADPVFGQGGAQALCANHGCVFLGQLPLNTEIQEQADKGQPIALQNQSPISALFKDLALKTAVQLALKPINYADKIPNIAVY